MKKTRKKGLLAISLTAAFTLNLCNTFASPVIKASAAEESYTQYVDPFVGTDVDYGQLFPGSVVPYGLVKLSPDTYPHKTDDHAGYDYSKDRIQGFSHTRVEGVGGQGSGGDILITPTYVNYSARPDAATKGQKYSHDNESANPGYYSVELTPKTGNDNNAIDNESFGNIKAEMTSDIHTGYHKYTFPKAGEVSLLLDLNYTYHGTDIRNAILDVVEKNEKFTSISGRFSGKNVSGNGKYTLYFYLETNKPTKQVKTWNNSTLTEQSSQKGNDIGAILGFDVAQNEDVEIKVSISTISSDQAKIDMHNEIDEWNFDKVKANADSKWNEILSKVKVENSAKSDPDGKLKKLFYTHLYHMFTTPVNATSTTGEFRATDTNVYEADDYTHYDSWTLWDDFRKYPMIGLVLPDIYKDIIRSLANTMEYGIGTWGIDTQTVPTVRTEHAVALLADGVAKGFTDIENLLPAYEKAKQIANNTVNEEAQRLGYIKGRVDKTVEFSYDDWAISFLSKALGNEEEYEYYLNRSFNYKNLYKEDAVQTSDGNIGLLWPKDANGNWMTANPEKYGDNGLYQGTLWQYTWWDSNDVNGLMDLMGGKENMLKALSRLYGEQDPDNGKAMLHTNTNEIDLHTPYLFNFAGKPSRTQYWVRNIYTKETWNRYSGTGEYKQPIYDYVYKLSPDGFMETMDDDAGTMASMFVAAAMGLFPMTPGDTTFQIGTPFFEKVTLDVGNGKIFVIEANNVSEDNFYIQSATLNGKSFDRTWVDYSEIIRGGKLSFNMGSEPSNWAENGVPAMSSSDNINTEVFDKKDPIAYTTSTFNEGDANDGSIKNNIVITSKNIGFTGNINEDYLSNGKIKISNIPEGLSASAVKTSENTIEVKLNGKALKHDLNDSIGDLTIELNDNAFNSSVDSIRQIKNNIKIMFKDDYLEYSENILKESKDDDGRISDNVTITLSGNSKFSGEIGEDFVEENKLTIDSLPEGLIAVAKKVSDKQVVLSFEGNAVKHDADVDDMIISFEDSAFVGAKACDIENSSKGGMNALLLDFYLDYSVRLNQAINKAKKIKEGVFTNSSYKVLVNAINDGQTLLDNGSTSEKDLKDVYYKINNSIDKLKLSTDGLVRLEGEKSDAWSENGLKNESINLGGTYNGAWIRYDGLDFSDKNVSSISVRYVNNSGRCASDSKIEVRKDELNGELIATIDLTATASDWNNYVVKTVNLENPSLLNNIHDIYFVMKGSTTDSKPYISNIDWLQFNGAKSYGMYEAESYEAWSGGNLKIENSTDASGVALSNIGGSYDGAWVSYKDIDFTGKGLNKISVRYVNNSSRCGDNSRLDIYLDSMESEVVQSIPIPATGSSWNAYKDITVDMNNVITGKHTVYFVMRTDVVGTRAYVANIDWFKFEEVIDKGDLSNLYENNNSLLELEDMYHEFGFNLFSKAMNKAKDVLENESATASDIRSAVRQLKVSLGQLELKIVDELNNLIKEAKTISQEEYTIDSYNLLQNAISIAEEVGVGSLYEVYKSAYDTLISAKGTLTKINKKILVESIEKANAIDLTKYKEESTHEFIEALNKAKEINGAVALTQKQVEDAVELLNNAMNSLVEIPIIDISELKETIEKAELIDLSKYIEAGKDIFVKALEEAKIIIQSPNTSEEVKEVSDKLNNAINALKLIPNKESLETLINETDKIDSSKYTEESIKQLISALQAAKAVFENKNADASEVESVIRLLEEAKAKLVKVTNPGTENPDPNPNEGNGKGNEDLSLPGTGDDSSLNKYMFVVLSLSAGLYLLLRKNKKAKLN